LGKRALFFEKKLCTQILLFAITLCARLTSWG
jgi:hypothetical protein